MSTEIRFYHLLSKSLESALPEILTKAVGGGRRVIVKTPDAAMTERLNEHLWTWDEASFLPHGTKKDGHASEQPIWLTDGDDNPNNATVLILTGGAVTQNYDGLTLCCDMLDGNDPEQVDAARARWKGYKEAGFEVTYWKQNEAGGWDKK
ncbi:MAG: DNA polymerase III subunit chi [Alphaproteobacteria bacterium]|nr:DNA polymerase III subunit chi [Alphaproteobacteria bacterium]